MADHGASSYSNSFIYDVFLSFRGEDTRHEFTDHLYAALCNKGINTFRDDPELRVGEEIRSTLLKAIETSRMSIVVLSQNYASSSWCLAELVKIMECHNNNRDEGRRVIPVYYHVEPSDVRHQKNQYRVDMEKHENGSRNEDKVKAWRSALFAVANLSGHHCSRSKGKSYESDTVNKIVEEVLKGLPREPLHIKKQVEEYPQYEEVKSLLDVGSHDAIYMLYMYGGDKTEKIKFVQALYNKIFHVFEEAHLLENVSTKSKSITGMEELQRVLLSMIDRKQHIGMGSIARGCKEIRQRLHNKKVLLILDDVDSVQQLESLAGGADWFGCGSRIIVTTGDEDIADKHVPDDVQIKKCCMEASESNNNPRTRSDVEEEDELDETLSTVLGVVLSSTLKLY